MANERTEGAKRRTLERASPARETGTPDPRGGSHAGLETGFINPNASGQAGARPSN